MSIAQASLKHFTIRFPWWRSLALGMLLATSLAPFAELILRSPRDALSIDVNSLSLQQSLALPYLLCFIPYAAACVLVLFTRPAPGRWRWLEIGLILSGALLLRSILLPLPPNLSRDSWRYVWDARVFLHGYSPYTTIPNIQALVPLHDFIYANSRFRTAPSLYPPAAQFVYVLSYLLAPSNLYALKGVFLLFDLLSCVVLLRLLMRKGLDPARVLLYAWCPLPIVEFALQGHVDALTITFTLLAALNAGDKSWRGRALTGFFVGLGTLAKLYPILMLATVVRLREWRRDWLLVLTCLLTIGAGYLPFFIQGHGQIFGYFSTYASEQGQNAGIVQQLLFLFGQAHRFSLTAIIALEHDVALLLFTSIALLIFLLRQFERISLEAGTLTLFALALAVSSHVFPWYATTLLPWLALLLPTRGGALLLPQVTARLLALLALWLFACLSVLSYGASWPLYYLVVYDPLAAELILAALISLSYTLPVLWQKGMIRAN
jgi:hypothetical protein